MAAMNLIGSYNYALVALSVFIAVFASYAALRSRKSRNGCGRLDSCAVGAGRCLCDGDRHLVNALHWDARAHPADSGGLPLADRSPVTVCGHSRVGHCAVRGEPTENGCFLEPLAGSVLMGAGIAGMHYIGMAAMRLPVVCQFNSSLVVLSVAFAVLISLAALWITFHFRDEKNGDRPEEGSRSRRDGCCDPRHALHRHGGRQFRALRHAGDLSHAVSISALGIAGIVAVTFLVLGLAPLTSWMDRRFAARIFELQEAAKRSVPGGGSEAQPHGQFRLETPHRRDHLVRGILSSLPIRPNHDTDRGTRSPTGSSGRRGARETDN